MWVLGMLRRYYFYDPDSDNSVTIGLWSYFWAGLFGVLFVLVKGTRETYWRAAGLSALCYGFLTVLLFVSSILPPSMQLMAVAAATPVVLALHSAKIVGLVRRGYYRRHWVGQQMD
jgi:hypothetical protein